MNNNTIDENRLTDSELKDISGGVKASGKDKTGKLLDLLDTALDCADSESSVKKAGIKGLKSIVQAIKGDN